VTAAALAALAAFGIVGGVLAGLVGIGGGAVFVPFLYLLLEHPAWSGMVVPDARITLVAHATSLLVIVPTALSALRTYGRAGLVPWRVVVPMGLMAAVSAALTTRVAPALPGGLLTGRSAPTGQPARGDAHPVLGAVGGLLVGAFSALLGVGGGLLAIPVLLYGLHVDLKRVAAASMGIVVFAAVAGTLGYLTSRTAGLPPGSVGWVLAPAALALTPGAVLGARWGAQLNQRLNVDALRRVFAVVFLALGLRLGWSAVAAPSPLEPVREGPVAPSPGPVS
jgi:uncharacterized membrane protein YfcA